MTTSSLDALKAELDAGKMQEGNAVVDANGVYQTGNDLSAPMYVDANSTMQVGGFPFALQLLAGLTDTSFSTLNIQGQSTTTANDMMHLTLVAGSNGTFATAGWARVAVTDLAGNITTGNYYIPFGTLS